MMGTGKRYEYRVLITAQLVEVDEAEVVDGRLVSKDDACAEMAEVLANLGDNKGAEWALGQIDDRDITFHTSAKLRAIRRKRAAVDRLILSEGKVYIIVEMYGGVYQGIARVFSSEEERDAVWRGLMCDEIGSVPVQRSWVERYFSWPWQPWIKEKMVPAEDLSQERFKEEVNHYLYYTDRTEYCCDTITLYEEP